MLRPSSSLLLAIPLVVIGALAGACGADGHPPADDDDDGHAGAGGFAGAGGSDGGASGGAGAAACVSSVPCVDDLQCAAMAGHVCNRGLEPASCQLLGCGADGTPCEEENTQVYTTGPHGDGLCAGGHCRHPASGPWVCRTTPLTSEQCAAVCASWNVLHECSSTPPCASLCTSALEMCAAHDGLSDFHSSPSCSGGGVAVCGDAETYSF